MKRLRVEALGALAILFMLSACSGEVPPAEGEPPAEGQPLTVCGVENADAVADMYCRGTEQRCKATVACCELEGFPATVQQCVNSDLAACRAEVLRNLEVGACFHPGAFDPACTDYIVDEMQSCSTAVLISPSATSEFEALGCGEAWSHGSLAPGEPCSSSVQCSEPDSSFVAFCFPDFAVNDEVNVCRLFERRSEGQSCGAPDDTCGDTLSCSSEDVCIPLRGVGEPCADGFSDCATRHCVEGVCADTAGQPCESFQDCGGFANCEDGVCKDFSFASAERCGFGEPAVVVP